jgi:hypothetical protein
MKALIAAYKGCERAYDEGLERLERGGSRPALTLALALSLTVSLLVSVAGSGVGVAPVSTPAEELHSRFELLDPR